MTKPFELFREVSRFGSDRGIALNDPEISSAFGSHAEGAIERALKDPIFLQGHRTEAMFGSLVQTLGAVRFIKPEDTGPIDADPAVQAPDFRIVLNDGSNWLVEVKNVYQKQPFRQRRRILRRSDRKALAEYAAATGGRLMVAIFWARWSLWTLIDPDQLAPGDVDLKLDMMTAYKANEMGSLGDQILGLAPPLTLRLTMDPDRTSEIGPDGNVLIVIGNAQIFRGEQELTHPDDQRIAWTVMHYGEWETVGPNAIVEGNRLKAIEFVCAPEQESEDKFSMAGSFSRMFARYYAEVSISEGSVIQINVPPQPEWFAALRSARDTGRMPIWRFTMVPNFDAYQ